MVVKTKDGWATNGQIAAQEAAWKKARKSLIAKLGPENIKTAEGTKNRAAEVFKEMDKDSNGSIDPDELKEAFAAVGVELTKKEVAAMMREADADGDGQIDAMEFENRAPTPFCVRPFPPLDGVPSPSLADVPPLPPCPLRVSLAQRGAPMEVCVHDVHHRMMWVRLASSRRCR